MTNPESTSRPGKVVHPRLPDEVHTRVIAFAERDRRTISNALVYLIERGLDAVEQPSTNDQRS